MKKVNIIIPKRDRSEFLGICLHYLNLCCADSRFEVRVYIVDDSVLADNPEQSYPNFKSLTYLPHPPQGQFNKSKLINRAISVMEDFDWFSIVDVDMIYSNKFLDEANKLVSSRVGYVTSHGYKLSQSSSSVIMKAKPDTKTFAGNFDMEEFRVGPSQISMTKQTYQMFIDIFGAPLYDEFYEGWGCEDSDLSFKALFMKKKNMLPSVSVHRVWYHLWHDSRNSDQVQYEKNYEHFKNQLREYWTMILNKQGGARV